MKKRKTEDSEVEVVAPPGRTKVVMQQPRLKVGRFVPLLTGDYDVLPPKRLRRKADPPFPEVPYADGEVFDANGKVIGYYAELPPCRERKNRAYMGLNKDGTYATIIYSELGKVEMDMRSQCEKGKK